MSTTLPVFDCVLGCHPADGEVLSQDLVQKVDLTEDGVVLVVRGTSYDFEMGWEMARALSQGNTNRWAMYLTDEPLGRITAEGNGTVWMWHNPLNGTKILLVYSPLGSKGKVTISGSLSLNIQEDKGAAWTLDFLEED